MWYPLLRSDATVPTSRAMSTVDLDTMPQRGCPTCGITSKTAVLWPKTTPAQVPLAPAKTPLRRPKRQLAELR